MRAIAGMCAWFVAACAPGATQEGGGGSALTLSADRTQYRAGDELVVTLHNRQAELVGYNLCPLVLERRSGTDWEATQQRLTEVCTMELRTLPSGQSANYRHRLPLGIGDGEYRVRTSVESPLGGGSASVASNPFRVTG